MEAGQAAGAFAGSRLRRALGGAGWAALLAAVGTGTAAAAVASNGDLGAAVAPAVLTALLYGIWKAPLRASAAALLFLLLALDNTYDAQGLWHSPVAIAGDLLRNNLDWVFPGMPRLLGLGKLSGMEILTLLLLGLAVLRRARHDPIDTRGHVESARVVHTLTAVFLLALGYAVANGLAGGGSTDVVIVQARPLLHIAVLLILFSAAFRGPADHVLLGKVVVLAAVAKAGMAAWVRWTVERYHGRMQSLTNHGDSILFAGACLVLLAYLLERPDKKRLQQTALFFPVILYGMRANHRRLAWVDLALGFVAIYLTAAGARWKRPLTRAAVLAAPVALLYVAVGLESSASIFKPVHLVQSVSDAKVDRSTLYRDVENWNLVMSIAEAPVAGRGFGHGYTEHMKFGEMLDISRVFAMFRFEPHNAVLGLILFGGLVAFTGMWSLLALGFFLAARSYRFAPTPEDRAAALCCLGSLVVVCAQFYGDLGQYFTQSRVFTALALAVAGKLAVATGAWPASRAAARGTAPAAAAGAAG